MVGRAAMTDLRRAVHLAVLAGLSASAYAGSLALVAMLQSTADATLVAERVPIRTATDAITASHDRLEAALAAATQRYGQVTDRYAGLVPKIASVEASLDTLATMAAGVTDSTLTLPTHVALPAVQAAPRVVRAAAPATQATTGASGR
jgi:hypothetical protein